MAATVLTELMGMVKPKPKPFCPWNPEQTLQVPPSPVDWLSVNYLVRFLLDLPAELQQDRECLVTSRLPRAAA